MPQDFKSFAEAASFLEKKGNDLKKLEKKGLREVGLYLRNEIRSMHGVHQPGWLRSTNPTPLLKTGSLRQAVSFSTGSRSVTLYSKMEWLALIHEYGATWKMSDAQRKYLFGVVLKDKQKGPGRPRKTWGTGYIRIPPRPIWGRVLRSSRKGIDGVMLRALQDLF